jgi:7 transmembrane receptor (Secretin family)
MITTLSVKPFDQLLTTVYSRACSGLTLCATTFFQHSSESRLLNIRERKKKRFIVYCLYAFGTPLVLTATMSILEHQDFDELRDHSFGGHCWIPEEKLNSYIYIPMSLIVAFNTFFYGFTAYKIYKVKKETEMMTKHDSKIHSRINSESSR